MWIKVLRLACRVLAGAARSRAYHVLVQPCRYNLQGARTAPRCNIRNSSKKAVTLESLNPNIIKLEYAVRGPLVIRAAEIEKELQKGSSKPFKKVIRANIGDAHAMGQYPITYIRQVLASVAYPPLIDKGEFPADVSARAKEILSSCGGKSVGAYSQSNGIEMIRRRVTEYIQKRDGHPTKWENITLSGGASSAIKYCLQLFSNSIVGGKPSGVLIPIPQYPLYSASLAEYGLAQVGYYLQEETGWSLDEAELERALLSATNCSVRALVVINPGNPTGQVLTRENIEMIIKFVRKHNLFLFADEVYQDNVYAEGSKFYSFKKVMTEMGAPYNTIELASFMSISKGYMGECGLRGGWMELINIDPAVQANLYKAISAMLCPTVLGQAVVDCVARPPQEGEPSFELFIKEKTDILNLLNKRAKMVEKAFNEMEGFKCNVVQGAMYAFPTIKLTPGAIEAAKKAGKPADTFYAFNLLEETGICIVPGSGFGQRPGTYHFRTTILPQPDLLQEMLDIFKDFHAKYAQKYK